MKREMVGTPYSIFSPFSSVSSTRVSSSNSLVKGRWHFGHEMVKILSIQSTLEGFMTSPIFTLPSRYDLCENARRSQIIRF